MLIAHLSTNDISGGAARAAYRLHEGLGKQGHQSSMLVVSRTSGDPHVRPIARRTDLTSRITRGLRQYRAAQEFAKYRRDPAICELFSDDRSEYRRETVRQLPPADVVNLHWVAGFVDYQAFFSAIDRPVVWTLHDMNPFTGGCHYSYGCDAFTNRCGVCPQLGSSSPGDLSAAVWKRKTQAFRGLAPSQLSIVAPSRWLAEQAARSSLFNDRPIQVIPYGLDVTDTYAPRKKEPIRDVLGIPHDARVVLFVAETVTGLRKGFSILANALTEAARGVEKLYLVSLGASPPALDAPVPLLHLGSVNNDRFVAMVYNASDLFVIPSLHDNLPNTVLEAMACGVPVVGTNVGGIPDMVRDGVNGLTVPPSDPSSLAAAIVRILTDDSMRCSMSRSARQIATNEYSLELQARRYSALYEAVVAEYARGQRRGVGAAS
jgi:glycosyltransferase involved in cell wall biosynthesis